MPKQYDFRRARYRANVWSTDGQDFVAQDVPIDRRKDVEDVLARVRGIPFLQGEFIGIAPLTTGIAGGNQVRLYDVLSGSHVDYDLKELDDDTELWTMTLSLSERTLPIGER